MPARDSTDLVRGDRENLYDVENWLAPGEAGRLLGVSGQWVTTLCRNGEVRGVRTALGWLIDPDEIEVLQEQRLAKLRQKIKDVERTDKPPPPGRGRVSRGEARAAVRKVSGRTDEGREG